MREFTLVPLSQSRLAPGVRQLVGQAANVAFESACRLLDQTFAHRHLLYIITQP